MKKGTKKCWNCGKYFLADSATVDGPGWYGNFFMDNERGGDGIVRTKTFDIQCCDCLRKNQWAFSARARGINNYLHWRIARAYLIK